MAIIPNINEKATHTPGPYPLGGVGEQLPTDKLNSKGYTMLYTAIRLSASPPPPLRMLIRVLP